VSAVFPLSEAPKSMLARCSPDQKITSRGRRLEGPCVSPSVIPKPRAFSSGARACPERGRRQSGVDRKCMRCAKRRTPDEGPTHFPPGAPPEPVLLGWGFSCSLKQSVARRAGWPTFLRQPWDWICSTPTDPVPTLILASPDCDVCTAASQAACARSKR